MMVLVRVAGCSLLIRARKDGQGVCGRRLLRGNYPPLGLQTSPEKESDRRKGNSLPSEKPTRHRDIFANNKNIKFQLNEIVPFYEIN